MKLSLVVTMAIFGLVAMSARALPQRRQSDTDIAVDENTLQGGGSLEASGNGNTIVVWPKCPKYNPKTGDDIVEDDLLSGDKPHSKPKLICYTYDVTPKGYEYAWENSDGSGSHQVCKLEPSKHHHHCRGGNCGHPGAAEPQVGPVSPISPTTDATDALDVSRNDDDELLEGGGKHKGLVCDIKGFYTYCTPEGILFKVVYTSDQDHGYVVISITQTIDKRCRKQHHHPGSALPF